MKTVTTAGLTSLAIAGTVLIGGAVVDAHNGSGEKLGHRLDIAAEVLQVDVDALKAEIEDSSFEEVLAAYGHDSKEAFFEAAEPVLRERLAEKGLSEEEIDEKIANMQERREVKEDVTEVMAEVLGLSRDEAKAMKEAGQSWEDILAAQGFDSREALRDAVADSLTARWTDEGVSAEDIDDRLERLEDRRQHRKDHRMHERFHDRFGHQADTDSE